MKTALQEAFSKLEELYPELFNVYSLYANETISFSIATYPLVLKLNVWNWSSKSFTLYAK